MGRKARQHAKRETGGKPEEGRAKPVAIGLPAVVPYGCREGEFSSACRADPRLDCDEHLRDGVEELLRREVGDDEPGECQLCSG